MVKNIKLQIGVWHYGIWHLALHLNERFESILIRLFYFSNVRLE